MAVEYATLPARPLLYPPDRPSPGQRGRGWVRPQLKRWGDRRGDLTRQHEDDAWGAEVQWAIARYLLTSVKRRELAAELTVGETQLQYYLRGLAWGLYGRPVLRALKRLGISRGRGNWTNSASPLRAVEIARASQGLMAEAAAALDGAVLASRERDRLLADLRLLSAASNGR